MDTISIGCGDSVDDIGFGSGGFDQGTEIGSGGTGGSDGEIVSGVPVNDVPEPGTLALLALGCAIGYVHARAAGCQWPERVRDYRRNRWPRDAGLRIDHLRLSKSSKRATKHRKS